MQYTNTVRGYIYYYTSVYDEKWLTGVPRLLYKY